MQFFQSNHDDMELNEMETGSGSGPHAPPLNPPLDPSRTTAYTHPLDSQDNMPVDNGPTFPLPFSISMPTDTAGAVPLLAPFTFGTSRFRTQNNDGPNKVRVVEQASKLPHLV